MHKELADLTFDELVSRGMELEINHFVRGEKLSRRLHAVMGLAVLWRYEKTAKENMK